MRATINFAQDVEIQVRKLMSEEGLSVEQAVNCAIRAGLLVSAGFTPVRTPTFRMGFNPAIRLEKASHLAGELEDAELVRRLDAEA